MNELISKGGPVMWPLFVCSVIALAVVLERILFWIRFAITHDRKIVSTIFNLAEKGHFKEAIHAGEKSKCRVAYVLSTSLAHRVYGLNECLEGAAMHEIEQTRRGLMILDTVITLAPLLGILGTVSGIIASFDLLGEMGIQDPKAVTSGIAQALLTTATGLTIAIITLIPYNAFVRKTEKLAASLEKTCTYFAITVQKGAEKQIEQNN
jgi:biopolymer transport protein ExbB